jgi:tellurite resistance protein
MNAMEDIELLKAALAVAVADRELRGSEFGLIEALAKRAGVEPPELSRMMVDAAGDETFADNIVVQSRAKARSALEMIVGLARIDGHISEEERRVLVRIAGSMGIAGNEFEKAYLAGIQRADEIRRRKAGS